ncbi:hypothetical protein ACFDTO_23045 [Microbacteriaceae bacterium 4G12]
MKVFRMTMSVVFVLFVSLLFQSSAFAAEKGIVDYKETVIPENQSVESVLILGHDVDVRGTIQTAVIVINGNLHIHSTANIKGPVLVIGGTVAQDNGAQIGEHVLSFHFNDSTQNSFLFGGVLFLGVWFLRLTGSLLLIMLTVLTGLVIQKKWDRVKIGTKQQSSRLLVIGAITSFALVALTVPLLLSIIGIPIVILLSLCVLCFFLVAMSLLSKEIGVQIKSMEGKAYWRVLTIGAMLLVAFMNIPLIGGMVILLVIWLSLGLMIKWLAVHFPTRKKNLNES